MPGMGGIKATRAIHETFPAIRILLLTLHKSTELLRAAFSAGADAYVLKSDAEDDLLWTPGQKPELPRLSADLQLSSLQESVCVLLRSCRFLRSGIQTFLPGSSLFLSFPPLLPRFCSLAYRLARNRQSCASHRGRNRLREAQFPFHYV